MSQENVDVVLRAYEAWNRDDVAAALALLHPEVEWRTSGAMPDFEPVYRGHEGFREWWQALKGPWEYFTVGVERTLESDDRVLADLRFEAVGKGSGIKVELSWANLWELEGARVLRWTAFRSWAEALEAVALRED